MRAVAIAIVFVAHCGLEDVIPGGFGVTIFFFLSGYLITTLLRSEAQETRRIDLRAFYIRRTLRIWPSLYITVFLTLMLSWWLPNPRPAEPWGVFGQLAFLSNYPSLFGNAAGVPGLPLWSLAVEEHFYLIFPLVFAVFFARRSPRQAAVFCAVACVAVLLTRIVTAYTISDIGHIYYWSHTRIDSILFGCCLALWHNPVLDEDAWRPRQIHLWLAVAVILACFLFRDEMFRQTLRYSLQGIALFVVFSYLIGDRGLFGRAMSSRLLRRVALYSYTLYLVHVPLIQLVRWLAPDMGMAGVIALSGALSMAYAAAMYTAVEAPAARWRRRLHTEDRARTA